MSGSRCLPPETHDHIVDFLHDDTVTLNHCCLVSKSWVSRARKHLFARITFRPGDHLKWSKAFPDPTNSPARHTRTLNIKGILEDAEEDSWLQGFSRVERLNIGCPLTRSNTNPLIPYRKLAPSLKSLCVASNVLSNSRVFDLVRFLPLLQDLTLRGIGIDSELYEPSTDVSPQTPPAFTGTLELLLIGSTAGAIRQLLNPPNHLRFRSLRLSLFQAKDLPSVAELVTTCSNTLEHLDLKCSDGQNAPTPLDISKATKLKDVTFQCVSLNSTWVVLALKTITPEHRNLRRISFHVAFTSDDITDPDDHEVIDWYEKLSPHTRWSWSELDRILVKISGLHSVRLELSCPQSLTSRRRVKTLAGYLFPEMTRRNIIDFVEEFSGTRKPVYT